MGLTRARVPCCPAVVQLSLGVGEPVLILGCVSCALPRTGLPDRRRGRPAVGVGFSCLRAVIGSDRPLPLKRGLVARPFGRTFAALRRDWRTEGHRTALVVLRWSYCAQTPESVSCVDEGIVMTSTQPLEHVSFTDPDEVREGDNWRLELLNLAGGAQVGRITVQPGWRWSQDVKPVAGTDLCMAPHQQYQLSGQMHVVMEDGTELDTGPGDVTSLPPGHDAWVVGEEPVVAIDWQGASVWAARQA
jgi:hypothetical protein